MHLSGFPRTRDEACSALVLTPHTFAWLDYLTTADCHREKERYQEGNGANGTAGMARNAHPSQEFSGLSKEKICPSLRRLPTLTDTASLRREYHIINSKHAECRPRN